MYMFLGQSIFCIKTQHRDRERIRDETDARRHSSGQRLRKYRNLSWQAAGTDGCWMLEELTLHQPSLEKGEKGELGQAAVGTRDKGVIHL